MKPNEQQGTYVIINRKTGEFVCGTDYRYSPPRQRTSKYAALMYDYESKAQRDFESRGCGRNYEIKRAILTIK